LNAAVGSAIVRATNGGKIMRTEWMEAKISALLFIFSAWHFTILIEKLQRGGIF
jgi:hypothetical protein